VADRLVAKPGTKEYGIPTAKAAWWVTTSSAGAVSRSVFWPVPNVDSKLVAFQRHEALGSEALRKRTFALIDAAFAQRRKMLRSALGSWFESAQISGDGAGGSALAQAALTKAGLPLDCACPAGNGNRVLA
jgi:16S rRNA (adenine1518-N6/adenine1519-N6)-dimethyltransferase